MNLTLGSVAEFTGAIGEFDRNQTAVGYSIDSRTLKPGELFFAIRGENFDGHDFVEAVLKSGAVGAVVRKDFLSRLPQKTQLLAVDDPLEAMQTLSTAVRKIWGKKLIAVTGSAGKTTTKEAIASLLSTQYQVLKSLGNLNNHFGLPLNLLKLEPHHDFAVVEMGMNHADEIARLAEIAKPDIGVVTMVAPVHLEFFNSVADIARAKYELIASLPRGAVAVLNADDEYVSQFGRDFHGKVLLFGFAPMADVRAENLQDHGATGSIFGVVVGGAREHAKLPLMGKHNIYNSLAAIAVAVECGVSLSNAVAALATIRPSDKRGETLEVNGATVINDCYNSNPKALKSMVDALASMPARKRIVVAGEMLELGPAGEHLHRECGEYVAAQKIDALIGVRGLAKPMVEAAKARGIEAVFVKTPEEAADWLAREVHPGDAVLLKASRGVKLERALEKWKSQESKPVQAD